MKNENNLESSSSTQGAREWLIANWPTASSYTNSFNDMVALLDSFASSRNAELNAAKEEMSKCDDVRLNQPLADSIYELYRQKENYQQLWREAESRVASLTEVVGELANIKPYCTFFGGAVMLTCGICNGSYRKGEAEFHMKDCLISKARTLTPSREEKA